MPKFKSSNIIKWPVLGEAWAINQTMPSNISSNANNTVEKGSPQLPILFVVQKSDHVGQENVIGLLTTKEYAELCDSIFKECLFNNIFWITQKCYNFPLNQLMKCL